MTTEESNDPKYPIYSYSLSWVEDGQHDREHEERRKGLPDGRVHNRLSGDKMFKGDRTADDLSKWVREAIEGQKTKRADKHPSDFVGTMVFVRRETWVLTWFSHETCDTGQTDDDALASFERYITRVQRHNYEIGDREDGFVKGHIELMGADDRWRWHGTHYGNSQTPTDPPCRCKFCKEQGVIRIGHS
jgi:hypothetical protein